MLYCNQPNVFTGSEVYIAFPENTFYTDVNFRYQMKARVAGTYSSKHVLQDDIIPVHAYFTLRIKTIGLPEKYQDKVVIASPNGEGGYKSYGGTYENGFVSTSLRTFGTFTVVIDTIPPVITSLNIFNNSNLAYAKSIDLTIYDKLSGISYYKATVDGKFILMERSAKNKLTYYFDDHVDRGEHIFRLEVTDNVGNTKVAEYNFRR